MNLFSGVKVIDLTRVFSGPFATRHFSDFGAEVIKIEPITGDDSRFFPPLVNSWSGYFELLNRNKKSLFLDLKKTSDLKKLYTLCKEADVFVENFSPGVKKRLGIEYETIRQLNQQIIYASVCGVSENVDKKYYDVIAQAESGLISLNGIDQDMKISTSIVDAFSGMKLAFAISAALFDRERTQKGQKVTVSMKGSAFDLLEQNLIEVSVTHKNPEKVGNMDNAIAPFGLFKAKDGPIVLAIGNDVLWSKFTSFIKSQNVKYDDSLFLTNDQRIENIDQLKTIIEQAFSNFSKAEIVDTLNLLNIPCGEVKTMSGVLSDEENFKEGLLESYDIPDVGKVVVPTSGIFFSLHPHVNYIQAPVKPK